ncbi:MAG: type IX secretion system membrane protein PorP/SprF [Crocinitomicaceae bacterium]|nr:type IX secretion system membrane protein PorP/SprF [Flavobacteriales bacterium]NQZ34156.1 type IX secretion system membrane protein PorP/SprF [Crocinitomicaceae bacterium]
MSNPSFSNIDMWLFELAEGNLSPEQVEQLELFLLNHPEMDVERDVWKMAKVEKQAIAYPNVADLERKRRPVVAFAFTGLFLLLLGSGSYIVWNGKLDGTSSVDLTAQNEQVKGELLRQIRNAKTAEGSNEANQSNSQYSGEAVSGNTSLEKLAQGEANESASLTRNEINSETVTAVTMNSTAINNSGNTALASFNGNQNATTNSIGLLNTASAQVQFANGSVTNGVDLGYVSTQDQILGNSEEVGNKEFFVRQPSEIDVYEGRIWNERKSYSGGQSITSSGSNRNSFKERMNKFARSLERMMNSPIALNNSRDPHYHIPGMTAGDINFSSAGTLIATRFQATSRLQWQGRENEQLMNQLSLDGYSSNILGGWGVQLNHQWYKNGGIQVAQAAFTYSPKISVSNWVSVEPSVRFKMGNKRLNAAQLIGTDVVELERGNAHDFYSNGNTPIGQSLWYKDLGVGLLVNTKWFFAGVQADNLFKYKDNLYNDNWSDPRRAQNHFTATIGSDWVSRNERLSLSPYVVYQKSEQLSEVWAGANFAFDWFNVGLATSSNLEPAASIGMKFDHFSLHYNADYTQSKMLGKKALSHQLTVRFVGKQNRFGKQLFKR